MRAWCVPVLLAFVACDEPEPEPPLPTGPCAPADGVEVMEFAQNLGEGPMADGDAVSYGTPPQGGAPYAPFQLRMQSSLAAGERVPLEAVAIEVATDMEIGRVEQTQSFLCANTGVHEGWLWGTEVHVRFPGIPLEDLDGREVRFEIALPDQSMVVGANGVLSWDL